jgi:hypothetical protein
LDGAEEQGREIPAQTPGEEVIGAGENLDLDGRLSRGRRRERGHHVIQKGPTISTKHVGTDGVHRDETDTLWLDGVATKP